MPNLLRTDSDTVEPILKFSGPNRFLSNFVPAEVTFEGVTYPTVEHSYVAAKTLDPLERLSVSPDLTSSKVKALGRKLTLRPDWDQVRLQIMENLLRQKFDIPVYKVQLLHTGTAHLEEGNHWNDTFWGTCKGQGENNLGKLLMKIRTELQEQEPH